MANEKRLIDANAEIRKMKDALTEMDAGERSFAVETIIAGLERAPTVEAVEVVHARWNPIRNFGGGECYGYCTNCKTPVKADNATGLVMSNRPEDCAVCSAKEYCDFYQDHIRESED